MRTHPLSVINEKTIAPVMETLCVYASSHAKQLGEERS